jgi:hypothetical protein
VTDSAVWVRTPATLERSLSDGFLVLPPDSADPLFLDDTAAQIWDVLHEPVDEADVVALMASRFDGGRHDVAGDVASFVEQMAAVGAIHLVEDSAAAP